MTNLMPEMTQKSAIGLVQLLPAPLALHIVRLRHIDGNYTMGVTSEHGSGATLLADGKKLEAQTVLGILNLILDWTSKLQKTVEKSPLCHLEFVPRFLIAGLAEIRNYLRKAAGLAERVRLIRGYSPVADVFSNVVLA